MATMTNCYKLRIGFKANPTEEAKFHFVSTLDTSEILSNITFALETGKVCEIGSNMVINMADASWFMVEWESCS